MDALSLIQTSMKRRDLQLVIHCGSVAEIPMG
jgi:hypothetical protein